MPQEWEDTIGNSYQDSGVLRQKLKNNVDLVVRQGMPSRSRAVLWASLSGAKQAMDAEPDFFETCKLALAAKPTRDKNDILKDVRRTMTGNIQDKGQEFSDKLVDVLEVFAFRNPNIGYCQGMNDLGAVLLLVCKGDAQLTFWMLDQVVTKKMPPDYFSRAASMAGVKADCEVLAVLCKQYMPSLFKHLQSLNTSLDFICVSWLMCVFTHAFPTFQDALRVWDYFMIEESIMLLRVALALIKQFERIILRLSTAGELCMFMQQMGKKVDDIGMLLESAARFNLNPNKIKKLRAHAYSNIRVIKDDIHQVSCKDKDNTGQNFMKFAVKAIKAVSGTVGNVKKGLLVAHHDDEEEELDMEDLWLALIRQAAFDDEPSSTGSDRSSGKRGSANSSGGGEGGNALSRRIRKRRSLVRKAGIPPCQRAMVWNALTNASAKLEANSEYYSQVVEQLKAKQTKSTKDIDKDVRRTMGNVSWFRRKEGLDALTRILCVFSFRHPHIGYCQSMSDLAGALLLVFIEHEAIAYWSLDIIINDLLPSDYYSPSMIGVKADCEVSAKLAQKHLPDLFAHFTRYNVTLDVVAIPWLMCLFLHVFPSLEDTMRVWDLFLVEGNAVFLRVVLALLKMFEAQLMSLSTTADLFVCLQQLGKQVDEIDAILELSNTFSDVVNEKSLGKLRDKARKKLEQALISHTKFIK